LTPLQKRPFQLVQLAKMPKILDFNVDFSIFFFLGGEGQTPKPVPYWATAQLPKTHPDRGTNIVKCLGHHDILFRPWLLFVFTVRRYALHGLSYRNFYRNLSYRNSDRLSVCPSVCPSVCHTRGLCPHGSTYDHDFFTIWQPHHSSFWGYHVHPKIRRGSPRARALNEGGVDTNWRFSTNKPPYLRNGARYDKGYN